MKQLLAMILTCTFFLASCASPDASPVAQQEVASSSTPLSESTEVNLPAQELTATQEPTQGTSGESVPTQEPVAAELSSASPTPNESAAIPQTGGQTVYDLLAGNEEEFSNVFALIVVSGLDGLLKGSEPVTLFAWKDDATLEVFTFSELNLFDPNLDPAQVREFLENLILPGQYLQTDLEKMDGQQVGTASPGKSIQIAVQDGQVKLNGSVPLQETDIQAANGVIHVIDRGLPPVGKEKPLSSELTITDYLLYDGRFETLIRIMEENNQMDGYRITSEQYTLFAPTDEVFAKLPPGTLEALTSRQQRYLLYYTSMRGKHMGADLLAAGGQQLDTLLAQPVSVTVENGVVMLNGVAVELTDIEVKNGVIHLIQEVLFPPDQ